MFTWDNVISLSVFQAMCTGKCEGVTVVGKCLEPNHSLLETNLPAGKKDGSQYAAWSEQAMNWTKHGNSSSQISHE